MFDEILDFISRMETPGFFVTAICTKESEVVPSGLERFIYNKLEQISLGLQTRKFIFQESGWRIILTFFPTDRTVDEKYALKNSVYKRR